MSWCDKLASTPTVGIRFNDHYVSSGRILDALAPLLNTLVADQRPLFSISKHDSFGLEFSTEEGFQYGLNQERATVAFAHKLKVRPVSGGPPRVEMLSRAMPFTQLLPDAASKLLHAVSLVIDLKTRVVERIGIVSTTVVADDELPPGIRRLLQHLGRPWPSGLAAYNCQFVANLRSDSKQSDRCVHHLVKAEGEEEDLITMVFDWQRTFPEGRSMTLDSLRSELDAARSTALEYFETLAIGDIFDEVVPRPND